MPSRSLKSFAYACSPAILHPWLKKIEMSTTGSRLASGVFWATAGSLVSRALMLCATILVARIFGKSVYGELGIIQSTVGMFGVFAGFGLGLTATKHVAEFRRNEPERAGRIIALASLCALGTGGLMALVLLIFAPWLAAHTINAPHLAGLLRVGALILFISALNGAQTGALSGFEAFRTIALVNLGVGLVSFPVLVLGAWLGGLSGAVWALVVNLGVNWLLNHLALRKEAKRYGVPLGYGQCVSEWPILWKFSLPAVLAGSMVGPINWVCSAMLVNRPNGFGEMGIYNAANQWYAVLMFLPGILGSVVLPVLSEQGSNNDTNRSRKILATAIKMNLFVVAPLVVVASVLSPFIMRLYGEGFAEGWPTLVAVLFTAGLLAVQTPVGQVIAASGRMWLGFAMNTGWALIFVGATYLLIDYNSLGLAVARLISYVVHGVWTFGFAYWLLRKGEKSC